MHEKRVWVYAMAGLAVAMMAAPAFAVPILDLKGHDKGGLVANKTLVIDDAVDKFDAKEALTAFDAAGALKLSGTNVGGFAQMGGDGPLWAGTDSGSFAPVAQFGGRGAHAIEKPERSAKVPEPGTLLLAGIGLIGIAAKSRRRRKIVDI